MPTNTGMRNGMTDLLFVVVLQDNAMISSAFHQVLNF
jgi:hypothetical protein